MNPPEIETISKEISESDAVYEGMGLNVKQIPLTDFPMVVSRTKFGPSYPKCVENIYTLLVHHPDFADKFRYDAWTQKMEILDNGHWRELEDEDYTPIQRRIQRMYQPFQTIGKDMVIEAVCDACRATTYDQAVDYVRSLAWDGTPRINEWIATVYGIKEDDYTRAVGANFFKGMVKRIIQPGCKFDTVLILEGKQGVGKSTSLSIIGGDWHLETTLKSDNKDFFMQFKGKLIVEFSEGESLNRSETKQMKAMISTAKDTYRAPYGRMVKDVPRRCVFAMSTNQNGEYLKDETGNRRFFPIEVSEKIDLEWLRTNRDQLFAEALHRVETLQESVYEYPESAKDRQASKMIRSSYEESIEEWLARPIGQTGSVMDLDSGVTAMDIWRFALQGDKARFRKAEEMQIALALKQIGYERKQTMVDGLRRWRWVRGEVGEAGEA